MLKPRMLYRMTFVLLATALGCGLGAEQSSTGQQSEAQTTHRVFLDVPSETMVFSLVRPAGKLVPSGTAQAIGVAAQQPGRTTLEYLSEGEHWLWVGSVEEPRFVRRSDVASHTPYAGNPAHSYLDRHSVKELAQQGLPEWQADAFGGCAEYALSQSGRLVQVRPELRRADSLSDPDEPRLDIAVFVSSIGDYVMGPSLIFTSTHCLGPHQLVFDRFDRIADYRDRDAIVLGAGSAPLGATLQSGPLNEENGMFLMLLAQWYRKVYVNDLRLEHWVDQNAVNREYAERCPAGTNNPPAMGEEGPSWEEFFCDMVKQPPTNIDFGFMGRSAGSLANEAVLDDGPDLFVIFPDPVWVWSKKSYLSDATYSLGADLRHLLRASSVAYVVTEQNLFERPNSGEFQSEGLEVAEHFGAPDLMGLYPGNPREYDSLEFGTLSKRWISVLSPMQRYIDVSRDVFVYHITTAR